MLTYSLLTLGLQPLCFLLTKMGASNYRNVIAFCHAVLATTFLPKSFKPTKRPLLLWKWKTKPIFIRGNLKKLATMGWRLIGGVSGLCFTKWHMVLLLSSHLTSGQHICELSITKYVALLCLM